MLPADLVEILACPASHQPLIYFPRGPENTGEQDACLVCPASKRRYRIDAGVPVMLDEESELLSEIAVNQLIARARALGLPVPT